MIETIIGVGSFLIDMFRVKAGDDDKTSEKVAEALNKIADLLDSTVVDLENDVYPSGKCAEMEMLSEHLTQVLKGDISEEYLDFLKINLNSAVELEKLHAYKDDPTQLEKIKVAAGYFRAAAILSVL